MAGILAGKSALVTGGAGGFGMSCAMLLARDGAAVTLMGRSPDSLAAAKDKLEQAHPGAKVQTYAGDGLSSQDVGAAMDLAASGEGNFSIVVSTVGAGMSRSIADSTADQFMDAVAYNVRPAFVAIREGIDRIARDGAFAFISSTAAIMPFDGMVGYCAGKAAHDHLVRTAAHELGHLGHRFNAVRPGLTRTPATVGLFASQPMLDRFNERIPLGRPGEPEEIAEAVRFLVGPESSWTTGQSFAIDGGNELRGAPNMAGR
ncbi:MAG: SDR family oxidoreductase [Acetobacteraceae bacterium]|nr:MAG: SDR family oxidoreductase [Acetobacteraceae bacterium]